jgi:hypothetical protein
MRKQRSASLLPPWWQRTARTTERKSLAMNQLVERYDLAAANQHMFHRRRRRRWRQWFKALIPRLDMSIGGDWWLP